MVNVLLQRLEKVREEKAEAEVRCSSLTEELSSVRALVQEGNHKINNFDAIKKYANTTISSQYYVYL